jgi:hypothetical protein
MAFDLARMLTAARQWTPDEVLESLGADVYYDAESGVFTTAAGSTAADETSDPIGRIEDQSGNARHMSQTAVSAPDRRPTLTDVLYNGHRAIAFDGTEDCWTSSFDASGTLPNATVYLVSTFTASARMFMLYENGWRGSISFFNGTTVDLGMNSDPDPGSTRVTVPALGATGIHVFVNQNKGAFWIDGTKYALDEGFFAADGTGTSLGFGARNVTDLFFGGHFCSALVFGEVHADNMVRVITEALRRKWGTP